MPAACAGSAVPSTGAVRSAAPVPIGPDLPLFGKPKTSHSMADNPGIQLPCELFVSLQLRHALRATKNAPLQGNECNEWQRMQPMATNEDRIEQPIARSRAPCRRSQGIADGRA